MTKCMRHIKGQVSVSVGSLNVAVAVLSLCACMTEDIVGEGHVATWSMLPWHAVDLRCDDCCGDTRAFVESDDQALNASCSLRWR